MRCAKPWLLLIWLLGALAVVDESQQTKLTAFNSVFGDGAILAFDSLTHGMVVTGEERRVTHHPYSIELTKLVNEANVKVFEFGVSGEFTKGMIRRLPRVFPMVNNIKLAVILGGTNDLGHRQSADYILGNLIKLHMMVHANASSSTPTRTIAIGIPPLEWPVDHAVRAQVNEGLREYATRCSHLVLYRDFEEVFDQNEPERTDKFYSIDKVHFSADGYDEIGRVLYNDLLDWAQRIVSEKKKKGDKALAVTC